jgi:protein TonB
VAKAAPAEAPPAAEPPPAPAPAQEIDPTPAPAPALPAAPPILAKADPAPAPASPGVEAVDAGSLAQYRLQLISVARKYKRYPRLAMDNNWEGGVVVQMVIGTSGMISALSIKTSSGHEVLDQQALEMFKKATPMVQIPPALRGKEFAIELRAIYSLKDQDSG